MSEQKVDAQATADNQSAQYKFTEHREVQGHNKLSAWTTPTLIALLAIACILLHLTLRYAFHVPRTAWQAPLFVTLLVGGLPLLLRLTQKLFEREFGSDHL